MKNQASRTAWTLLLASALGLGACDDDVAGPLVEGMITADVSLLDFGSIDVAFGASAARDVTITNSGASALEITTIGVVGADLGSFAIVEGGGPATLGAGASHVVSIAFDPTSTGMLSAVLRVVSDDRDQGTLDLTLEGTGERYTYTQVDRMGIPALNTVFNHPPAFSKVDYNTASPSGDVAAYTGLFETVLGAVANPDPAATAALLLPDELPVSLAAGESNFALLNGRKPSDDATDVALSVVVGIEALHSDNVDANDVAFSSSFPYFAPPHN